MFYPSPPPAHAWWVITHLGSPSLMMPAFALVVLGLWVNGARAVVGRYMLRMALAVLLTTISKCLFLGWGIGSATLDFTGVSGHAMLATSILPLLMRGLPWQAMQRRHVGAALGAALALAVGVSRVVVGAHSVSEVVAAWLLGAGVSAPAVRDLREATLSHGASKLAPLILLLALHTPAATYVPSHSLEVRLALWLSGHSKPFNRQHLR